MNIDKQIYERERIKLLYKKNHITLGLAFFASVIFFIMFKSRLDLVGLIIIFVPYNFFTFLRSIACKKFWDRDDENKIKDYFKWEKLFVMLTLASGLSFALMTFWCFAKGDYLGQLFCIAMTLGYSAGANNAYGASLPTIMSYSVPTLMTLIFCLIINGGEKVHTILSVMTLLFLLNNIRSAKSITDLIRSEVEYRFKSIHSSKLGALAEMAAGMAHEINNPLTVINGQISAFAKVIGAEDEENRKRLDKILVNIKKITTIINGLKNYSKDISEESFENISVDELLRRAISACKPRINSSNIKIEIEDFPKDIKINGRSFELNQAIVNLVNNAIDAAENTVEKWIKVYHKLKGRQIIVYIEDSGNGIPAHIYENMTSPFFTTKEVGKGTGLGLSTAIGIIESHGGELRYLPDKKNTVFTFSLPIV